MNKESSQVTERLLDNKQEHREILSQSVKEPETYEEWAKIYETPLPNTRWN